MGELTSVQNKNHPNHNVDYNTVKFILIKQPI